MSGLLPQDYEIPSSSGSGLFAKLQKGENRFRILDMPTMGYIYWDGNTPVRIKNAADAPSGEKPKHFWHVPVWMDNQVKLLDIDKATVLTELHRLDQSNEWGNLLEYDVIVIREGDSFETKYSVQPCPKKALPKEASDAWMGFKDEFNPNEIFEGATQSADKEKLPF